MFDYWYRFYLALHILPKILKIIMTSLSPVVLATVTAILHIFMTENN